MRASGEYENVSTRHAVFKNIHQSTARATFTDAAAEFAFRRGRTTSDMTREKDELTTRTMTALVRLIDQRNYAPGERLPSERELAERFGVGRGVVREVLSVLEGLRYLERRPNSGIYLNVAPERISLETLTLFSGLDLALSTEQLAQTMEVRRIIEVQAVILAAQRRTDEDIANIGGIVARFDEAVDNSIESVANLDYEFHMAIFRATHNLVLMQLVSPFYIMSENRRLLFFKDKERSRASNAQHRQIFSALADQDAERAKAVMSDHIGRVERHYGL
ncbi:FadR/GntR family transcriptional regulator [Pusillimonas sp. SM2304]|uniref:FadR/GntR family transcriptional regulator n=1 Tax=Pusillimonas sp. SM2304 TaxID=3073241 RepID=UPI002876CE30|nr:FadR/GntR family transcriptional regulator [Pusillimonas sp. SM2304]MDS1140399.1 FadR/GntR family transcriptional regulator [Pusillimonas sp. SM2304]